MNKNNKLKILAIAPYQSLKNLIKSLANNRNDIHVDVVIADLDDGIIEVQKHSSLNYDIIISRGATAKKIKEHTNIPVVEIPLSMYDILRRLNLLEYSEEQSAIVGFSELTTNATLLCNLIQYDIKIITITKKEEILEQLNTLKKENYTTILCDTSSEIIAQKIGLNPLLVTSGVESIENAFNTAVALYKSFHNYRDENFILKEALKNQIGSNFILDSDKNIVISYSKFGNSTPKIEQYLQKLLENLNENNFTKSFHLIDGDLYSISLNTISTSNLIYYIFSVDSNPVPQSGSKHGIRFSNKLEMHDYYHKSFFSITNSYRDMYSQINAAYSANSPIMILGEKGTGKDQLAAKIYIDSPLSQNPYISINCELINQKHWNYLINNYNSPLCDNDNTIYISNIHVLTPLQRKQLLSLTIDTNLCKRNNVIFSCSTTSVDYNIAPSKDFIDNLLCITLNTRLLREFTEDIPKDCNLYLNKLNIEYSKEIIGIEPKALEILKSYSWPQNYMQLKRILLDLVIATNTPYIKENTVYEILEKEYKQFPVDDKNTYVNFNYNRTLYDMNKDIINKIIDQCKGNQTQAAKQLGISRTTIWRYIN